MNKGIFNNKHKKNSKGILALKIITIAIIIIVLLFFLMTLLSTEQRVRSLNAFLSSGYWYFLVLRIAFYCIVVYMCLRMKLKIKLTPYYKSFLRTCFVCTAFVCLNEVMLYIRLME